MDSLLTTTQLAARTGLAPATLRMWERRYAFPEARRERQGRHRRYSERDVERVLAVNRLRAQGVSLRAAIARARQGPERAPLSIFAGLRRRHPELAPLVLAKPALLALTRAVEDEHRAHAPGGLLIAGFQHERFYRQAERRWRELAVAADLAVALADFERLRMVSGGPIEVPAPVGQPLSREWFLVADAPGASACVAGLERAHRWPARDSERVFEVLWSMEPDVVGSATALVRHALEQHAPSVAVRLPAATQTPPTPVLADLRFATALAGRALAYLTGAPSL